ncbi:hypothetical protein BOX15_Mlig022068g1, partial [Macrostomum lignano]
SQAGQMTYQLRRISDREGFGKTPSVIIIRRQSTIIGRASSKTPPDCVIESQVNPMMVSRKHAEVRAEEKGNRYFLVDHSLNGTYINYTRILSSKLLVVGDIICFGHVNGFNIKPGSTVNGFRSELKFVFEKVSNSPAGPAGPPASSGDHNPTATHGDGGRKRLSGGEAGGSRGAASAKRARDKSPDSSMSSSQSSPSNDLSPAMAPHPAPPVSASKSSAASIGGGGGGGSASKKSSGEGKKSDTKKSSSAAAKRQSSVDSGGKGGSVGSVQRKSGASRSSKSGGGSRPSKQSKQSRGSSGRPSGSSSAAVAAGGGDPSGQFHIDGEPCESLTCIKPKDPNVNWVCCDSCNSWYHVMCTDLDDDVNLDDIEFFCIKCRD